MQIQLPVEIREALRRRAFEERKSVAAVVREILAGALIPSRAAGAGNFHGFTFVGIVEGDGRDVAERHDEFLGDRERW